MALSRRIIVSSILLLFAIPSQSQDFVCPAFEEPAECPQPDWEESLCHPEGKIGLAAGCPPNLICCNAGCHVLDCVVPAVTPTPSQPQKNGTKVAPGDKNISVPAATPTPTQPEKVGTKVDPGDKNISDIICPVFEESGECPPIDEDFNLCHTEGKIGSAAGCPPNLICCNDGCHILDCVVPAVTPTSSQRQKVTATEDPGKKNVSDSICPAFEEPAECPIEEEESLCHPEGKIGPAAGCPPSLVCCNTGCQFLDCVVPAVTLTPSQRQKVTATEDPGKKNVSVSGVTPTPTQPKKVTATEDPGKKNVSVSGVTPTPTQPKKVTATEDPGKKNVSGPKGAPSLPQKAVTTQAPAEEPVCNKVANVFLKLKRQLDELEKELKNLPKSKVEF